MQRDLKVPYRTEGIRTNHAAGYAGLSLEGGRDGEEGEDGEDGEGYYGLNFPKSCGSIFSR